MRTVSVIDYAEAQRIVDFIVERATEIQKSVAIAVADAHGELIAFARMDGVPLPSVVIAMNKAWTAARTGKPTHEIGEKVKDSAKRARHCLLSAILDLSAGVAAFRCGKMVKLPVP